GDDEALWKLVAKVLDNLTHDSPAIREPAVSLVQEVQNILQIHRKSALTRQLTAAFLELAEKEDDPRIYRSLVESLQADALDDLIAGRLPVSIVILRPLLLHSLSDFSVITSRRHIAVQVL